MESFLQTMRSLGPARLAAIGVVAAGLIGFFFFLTARLSQPNMELLYGELSQADAAAIGQQLTELNLPFEVDPSGTQISVPADQVGRLRMLMAQSGLPNGGSLGYELFDQPEGFGATSFIQNMNRLRAMEGEMARTVGTLAPVDKARVHLVLPKRELFSRTSNTATASVFLKMRPGMQLSREQIASIQHLIAAAVPNLEPSRVSIVNDQGKLLARGTGEDTADEFLNTADEKERAYEQRLTQTIEELLGRTLGFGKVRAEVSAEMDFDRVTTSAEIYDPESRVVRSTQTVEEREASQERDPLEPITVDNNLPGAQANDAAEPLSSTERNRTEETVNYEMTRTMRQSVREIGQVRRLSIAVLVDGRYEADPNSGEEVYQPRSDQELQQLERLVRSAVGYDAQRGDVIELVNMRFVAPDAGFDLEDDTILGIPKQDVFRMAEMLILGIVAILIILLVVRPLISRAFERPQEAEDDVDRLLTDQSAAALAGAGMSDDLALEAEQADEDLEQMIDINRVEGRVRASSLRKVGEIVDKHPEEAVAILRNWLYQET